MLACKTENRVYYVLCNDKRQISLLVQCRKQIEKKLRSYELCLGLGTYMLEAWEKWRQNAISHMSYHFVARFNISKHSTTAQLSYFSPHCRRSMILMPTAPKATAAAATVAAAAYVGGKWRNDKNSLSYIGRACHWLGTMGWDPFYKVVISFVSRSSFCQRHLWKRHTAITISSEWVNV